MPTPTPQQLVLCGPILRKITSHSVAVFLALRDPKSIELTIHLGDDSEVLYSHASLQQPQAATVPLGKRLHVAVVQLDLAGTAGLSAGNLYTYNLFFRDPGTPEAAGIDLRHPAVNLVGSDLVKHIGYAQGKLPAFSLPPHNFDQFNIVHGSCRKPHGGGRDMLARLDDILQTPSHRLDNQDLSQYADPVNRPHLLLLTGDQIYADDVSPPLLRALHDAAGELLGWREEFLHTELPGNFGDQAGAFQETIKATMQALNELASTDENGGPSIYDHTGQQLTTFWANLATLKANFPDWHQPDLFFVGYPSVADHLEQFQESITETWEAVEENDSVSLQTFLHHFQRRLEDLRGYFDFFQNLASDRHWGQIEKLTPAASEKDDIDAIELAYQQLPRQDLVLSRLSPPQRAKELKEFAAMTSDAMDAHLMFLGDFYMMYLFAWSDEPWPKDADGLPTLPHYWDAVPNYSLFGDLSKRKLIKAREVAIAFARDLPKVRRVLANIPTLMIFDDHEITDDWNLNEEWVLNVNKRPEPGTGGFGAHLLRNGLAAYAIFQDWGNRPEDYQTGTAGAHILDHLRVVIEKEGGAITKVRQPGITTPEGYSNELLFESFGLGNHAYDADLFRANTDYLITTQLASGIRKKWHWHYEPYAGSDQSFFKLIALDTRTWRDFPSTAWNLQYQHFLREGFALQKDAYIGRKGPANLIHPAVLDEQLAALSDHLLNLIISPAPVFGLPLIEDGLQRLSAMNGSVEEADYESWQGNHIGFQVFREKLANKKIVLLSGDVHYAYTNYLKFFDEDGQQITTQIAQLCSSSMKNESQMTEILGSAGRMGHLLEFAAKPFNTSPVEWGKILPTLTEAIVGMGENFSNVLEFTDWFSETAPIVPWNDQARIKYYLNFKDYSLFNFEMLLPDGLWQMGSGAAAFFGRDFFFGHLNGIYDRSEGKTSFQILFLKDHHRMDPEPDPDRFDFLKRINPLEAGSSGDEVDSEEDNGENSNNNVDLSEQLVTSTYWAGHWDEMREVVGYNNIARIFFQQEAADPLSAESLDHYLYWQLHKYGKTKDPLSYTSHHVPLKAGPSSWKNFKQELIKLAREEYQWWNPPGGPKISETINGVPNSDARSQLEKYYTVAGFGDHFSGLSDHQDLVWGAVFISYLMKMAQAGAEFPASRQTIAFMRAGKKNRLANDQDNRFWLYDLHEIRPEAGDLLCNWRDDPFTYSDIDPAADTLRPAQCSVIISISEAGLLTAVGGNFSDSLGAHTLALNDEGYVPASTPVDIGTPGAYNAILRIRTEKAEPENN